MWQDAEAGFTLFAELKALRADSNKEFASDKCMGSLQEDYFNEATGVWDMEGLKDDLRSAKAFVRVSLHNAKTKYFLLSGHVTLFRQRKLPSLRVRVCAS